MDHFIRNMHPYSFSLPILILVYKKNTSSLVILEYYIIISYRGIILFEFTFVIFIIEFHATLNFFDMPNLVCFI